MIVLTNQNFFQHFHRVFLQHRGSDGWKGAEFNIHWTDGSYTRCDAPGFLDDSQRKDYINCNF